MPFCPQCGAEYLNTISVCPDCEITIIPDTLNEETSITCLSCGTLNDSTSQYCYECGGYIQAVNLERIPFAIQGETMQCHNCSQDTPLGIEYCIHCGYIFTDPQPCVNHPDKSTRFICLVCKKPFCKKCSVKISNGYFCHEHADYHIVGNWVELLAGDDELEMEQVKGILENENIYVVLGSRGNHHRPWNMGLFSDSMIENTDGRFRLLVPIIQLLEAEKLLIEAGVIFENTCFNCGHEFNGDSPRCPNCGEEFI